MNPYERYKGFSKPHIDHGSPRTSLSKGKEGRRKETYLREVEGMPKYKASSIASQKNTSQ